MEQGRTTGEAATAVVQAGVGARARPCVEDAAMAGARRRLAGARQGFAGVEERGGVVVVERKHLGEFGDRFVDPLP